MKLNRVKIRDRGFLEKFKNGLLRLYMFRQIKDCAPARALFLMKEIAQGFTNVKKLKMEKFKVRLLIFC